MISLANPQSRPDPSDPDDPTKRIPVIAGITEAGNNARFACAPDLYLHYAGSGLTNRPVDGLDFRKDTTFVIYLQEREGKEDLAVGLDIFPTVMYKGNTVPASVVGVDDLTLRYFADGVVEVVKRPFNMRLDAMRRVVKGLNSKTSVDVGNTLPGSSRVVNIRDRDIIVSVGDAATGTPIYN